jgi:hypothetical protein
VSARKIGRHRALAVFGARRLHPACRGGDQEGPGAAGRVEQQHGGIEQAARAERLAQRPIRRGDHEAHHGNGGEEHAVPLLRLRVEDGEEVLVEIEDRVLPGARPEQVGVHRVHRVQHHVEGGAEQIEDLVLRQRPQRRAQQRIGPLGQPAVGVAVEVRPARLARQQQAEGEGLGEGVGEQRRLVRFVVAAGGGVGEQGLAELVAHGSEIGRRAGAALVGDHGAHQPRRLRQRLRHLRRAARHDRPGQRQRVEHAQEGGRIGAADQPLRRRVRGRGVERRRGQDHRLVEQCVAPVEVQRVEIAEAPQRQLAEAAELVRVVAAQPPRVERLARLLQLDEGAGGRAWPREGDVRPAYALAFVLRQHARRRRHARGQHGLDQRLEARREKQLEPRAVARDTAVGAPVQAHLTGICDQRLVDHGSVKFRSLIHAY